MNLSPLPIQKFFDNNGRPLVGGLLFTYEAGTSNKIATYTDASGGVTNTNPIVLDFRGEARVWLDPELTYKFILAPADDTDPPTRPIWTVDDISLYGGLTPEIIGQLLWPLTAAEANAGFTGSSINFARPYGNIQRYKIVANNAGATSANSTAFALLTNPTVDGPVGDFYFPNDSGTDVYYFNDLFQIRGGMHFDLQCCTLNCTKTITAADSLSALFYAIYDVTVENGSIVMNLSGTGATNGGMAAMFGSRYGYPFGQYPAGVFDQTDLIDNGLPPQGKCWLKNIRITTNNPSANALFAVLMLGGLRGGGCKGVTITGNGNAGPECGIYYEFGHADANGFPATAAGFPHWSSSHATALEFDDVEAIDLKTNGSSDAHTVVLVEAWDTKCTNIRSNNCFGTVSFRIGEAHFYRPWIADADGCKRGMEFSGISTQGATGTAIIMNASQGVSSGYLSDANMALAGLPPLTPSQKVDLMSFTLNGFGVSGDVGISVDGAATISDGTVSGCTTDGVAVSGECRSAIFNNVIVLDSGGTSFRADSAPALFPNRRKFIQINGGRICGGVGQGVSLNYVQAANINGVQIGYNTAFDNANEATQTIGVLAASDAYNVICTSAYVTTSGGAEAYNMASSGGSDESRGNGIVDPQGTTTYTGKWRGVYQTSTPVITCTTPGDLAITYTQQHLTYVRSIDGSRVDYTFRLETSAFTHTTASGTLIIQNLPYTVNSAAWGRSQAALSYRGITKATCTQFTPESVPGTTQINIIANGSGVAFADVAITDLPTGGSVVLRGSGQYFV
jgi:hypothetical protein